MRVFVVLLLIACTLPTSLALGAITFVPGHFYASNYDSNVITQYDASRTAIGSVNLGREVKGITFGPDGLLYAVTRPQTFGFEVLAINGTGGIEATYASTSPYIGGNLSYGKIAVGNGHLYVAGGNVLTRFQIGNPASAATIYDTNQVYDVEVLPSGNLLVASAYEVQELTPAGTVVRNIEPSGSLYTDIRGVEFDPATNNMFVTHLGHTGFFFQIMRVDWLTGALEESITLNYADDLFVTEEGNLLVGSRTQIPRLYSQDLDELGSLGGAQQMFITQYTIPEPSTMLMVLSVGVALIARRNRHKKGRN